MYMVLDADTVQDVFTND